MQPSRSEDDTRGLLSGIKAWLYTRDKHNAEQSYKAPCIINYSLPGAQRYNPAVRIEET